MVSSPSAFGQRVIRVNLTTGSVTTEQIDPRIVRLFVGGRGLGAYLLYRDSRAGVDPLGPENQLIFATGPLCGTAAPGSSRYAVVTKSPLTGLYLMSISGGYFGGDLRRAGCDVLVLEGRAEKPSYLVVESGTVEVRDATRFWGMNTLHTQEFLSQELGSARVSVACIGPAGENQIPYASIMNERRSAGRGGAGAVMGSKNVKAIVARRGPAIQVIDPEGFRDALRHAAVELRNNPNTGRRLPQYGTSTNVTSLNAVGILPIRNWQKNSAGPESGRISGETTRPRFVVKDMACAPPCPVRCGKLVLVREGEYAGTLGDNPDYETLYAFGACCEVWDPEPIFAANALCDELGLDTISTGVSIAFAMECFERGLITTSDTGGVELRFGSHEVYGRLIRDIAYRRGFGALLARGTRKMAEDIGQGSDRFAMHVKGLELGGYDPRGATGMALVYACGPRGGCHHAGGYTVQAELGGGRYDRFSREGKAALVKATRDRRAGGSDSALMCNFVSSGMSDETFARMLAAVTGWDFLPGDIYLVGERISTVERLYNVREGLTPAMDTLPPRLLEESAPTGPAAGRKVHLASLIEDFYKECGWDVLTGCPTEERIRVLGLDGVL